MYYIYIYMWWDPNIDMEISIYIYILIYCTYRVGSKHWIDYEQTCLWWTGWYVYHPASDEESSWSCDKLNNKPPILEGQNRTISGNIIYIWVGLWHWVYHIVSNDPSIIHQSSTIVRYTSFFNHWLTINSPLEQTFNHYESLLINY
jgi:hypothetical protein